MEKYYASRQGDNIVINSLNKFDLKGYRQHFAQISNCLALCYDHSDYTESCSSQCNLWTACSGQNLSTYEVYTSGNTFLESVVSAYQMALFTLK